MRKLAQTLKTTEGIIYGLLSGVFVAGYITTNKYIFAHYDITAIQYALVFAVSGALYASLSLAAKMNRATIATIKNNYRPLLVLGLAGMTAVGIFTIGQHYTTAVNSSLLMTSSIIATALFSKIFLNEHFTKAQYIWMLLLFAGIYIGVVGFNTLHFRKGDLIVLSSVIFFGFGNSYSRVVMKRLKSAHLVPDVRLLIGGVIATAISFFVFNDLNLLKQIAPLALLAGAFYWLCMKSFAKAVYLINANNTIVLNNAQIFFTSLAGVLLLSEHYTLEKLLGSVIAIVAIYFIAGRRQ